MENERVILKPSFQLSLRRPALIFLPPLAAPAILLETAVAPLWRILLALLVLSILLYSWRLEYFKWIFILFLCLNLVRCLDVHKQASRLIGTQQERSFTLQERLWKSPQSGKSGWQASLDTGEKFALTLPSKFDSAKRLSGNCHFKEPEHVSNPGGFDEYTWLLSKGISLSCDCSGNIQVLSRKTPWLVFCQSLKDKTAESLRKTYGKQASSYIGALLIGEKSALSKRQKYYFSRLSLQHLLSVSGMHLAFILLPLRAIRLQEKYGRRIALICQYTLIFIFYCLASAPAGLFRAILVLGLRDFSRVLNLRHDSLNSLALALMVLLLINPFAIYDRGIIWSFGAAATIFSLRKPISQKLARNFPTLAEKACSNLAVMLSAQFAVIILSASSKARFSIFNFFIQLPLLAIFQTVFISSAFFVLLALIPLLQGIILKSSFVYLSRKIFTGLDTLLEFLAKLPEKQILHPFINAFSIFALLLLFMYLLSPEYLLLRYIYKRFRWPLKLLFFFLLLLSQCLGIFNQSRYLTFVDVGQGDGFVLSSGNKHLLIDGGVLSQAGKTWLPYMEKEGIIYFDTALITHADADHMAAAAELVDLGKVRKIIIPLRFTDAECRQRENPAQYSLQSEDPAERLLALCKIRGIPVNRMSKGQQYQIADHTRLTCLAASAPPIYPYEDSNESSLITLLEMDGLRILLTADMTERQELNLIKENLAFCHIHKVAHHGSGKTTYPTLLKQVQSELSLISVGKNNSYGHPHPALMQRLRDAETTILRTDEDGAVRVRSVSSNNWQARSYKSKFCLHGVK